MHVQTHHHHLHFLFCVVNSRSDLSEVLTRDTKHRVTRDTDDKSSGNDSGHDTDYGDATKQLPSIGKPAWLQSREYPLIDKQKVWVNTEDPVPVFWRLHDWKAHVFLQRTHSFVRLRQRMIKKHQETVYGKNSDFTPVMVAPTSSGPGSSRVKRSRTMLSAGSSDTLQSTGDSEEDDSDDEMLPNQFAIDTKFLLSMFIWGMSGRRQLKVKERAARSFKTLVCYVLWELKDREEFPLAIPNTTINRNSWQFSLREMALTECPNWGEYRDQLRFESLWRRLYDSQDHAGVITTPVEWPSVVDFMAATWVTIHISITAAQHALLTIMAINTLITSSSPLSS